MVLLASFYRRCLLFTLVLMPFVHQPLNAAPNQGIANNRIEPSLREVAQLQDPELQGEDPAVEPLLALAMANFKARKFSESARLFEEAWAKVRLSDNKMSKTSVLLLLIMAYNVIEPQKAFELSEQALPLVREVGLTQVEPMILMIRGRFYRSIGQPQQALQSLNQALQIQRQLNDKSWEPIILGEIGLIYNDLGEPQQALEFLHQELKLQQELGDKSFEAMALFHISQVYLTIHQPIRAAEFFSQAIKLMEEAGDPMGEANILQGIGVLYLNLQRPQEAQEYLARSLPIWREYEHSEGEAVTLYQLGICYSHLKQPQKALTCFRDALAIFQGIKSRIYIAGCLYNMGLVHSDMNQLQQAKEYFNQALPITRNTLNKQLEVFVLTGLAVVDEREGNLNNAASREHTALTLVEGIRESLGGLSQSKVAFLESNLFHYHFYIDLMLRQDKVAEAFTWVEKTKARALLDLMFDGKVNIAIGLSTIEQRQEQQLIQKTSQLNQQLVAEAIKSAPNLTTLNALKQQLSVAETSLQQFMDGLYAKHPELARKRAARTVTLNDIAQFLPADTALLNYIQLASKVGNKTIDKTYLFCVTGKNAKAVMQVYPVQVENAELQELTDDFREACTDPNKNYRVKARDLYNLLIAPAAQQLKGKSRLIVCPDGVLWGLPFQALINKDVANGQKQFLVEQYEVNYAYSATAVQAALGAKTDPNRTKPVATLLALANPDFGGAQRFAGEEPGLINRPIGADARPIGADARPIGADAREVFTRDGAIKPLPGTQKEATALKINFPNATIKTGAQAQESTAKQDAGKYRYLHFATHGLFNDAAPMLSSVVLAQPTPGSAEDGFLTAREIFDLNWNADMVVLSACNTARGEKRSGEGVVGLAWALFVAGAPTQVVSQWAVNDDSTALLMQHFYNHLKQNQAKGASLQKAELALLKDGQHEHPYYWAPFILMGDYQ